MDFVALKPGQVVGRYEILAVLGQGGFGITYRARDSQLAREVALKEYLPTALAVRHEGTTVLPRSTDVAEDFTWGRERFVAEGRTLASLHDSPAIVRVHDFLEANGTAYIVMELVRGETLEKRLARGTLGPAELDAILWPLLDGLEQVHAAGFLHRDIKPANILISPSGKPTLIDFGASRAAMAGRTTAMTAIFTPGYAAAEQFTSAPQGPWTDVYGLAATLYRALAGTVPPSAFDRMLDDHYKPLKVLAPRNFSPKLLEAIDAGMAVRVGNRPQSIAAWRALLTGAAAADDPTKVMAASIATPAIPTVVSPPPDPPAPSPGKSRLALYAGGAAALALLLVGGWLALAPRPMGNSFTTSLQEMKVEDLERVLVERKAADEAAAEKWRLEEEAQKKAAADAAAKTAADAEVVKAEAARKKAEEELQQLKAQYEAERKEAAERQQFAEAQAKREAAEAAQRKAETDMAALRQAEDDTRKKAAADAETKRQADEALARAQAERAKADADAKAMAEVEAKQKAEADAKTQTAAADKAKADAEAVEKKAAETAENGLRLDTLDRQHLQVALTSLGFDTHGNDGVFGSRSREMIAVWQKARNQPATGFLNAAQQQALLKETAPAIAKYDDQQRKIEEEKKKADEDAKAAAAAKEKQQTDQALDMLSKKPAATTPVAPGLAVPPTSNSPLEEKNVFLNNTAGGACGFGMAFHIRIYPNNIEIMKGTSWQAFGSDLAGDFRGSYQKPDTGTSFLVSGNLKTRKIMFSKMNSAAGCNYVGAF